MKRVWSNTARWKKIVGLVVLCLVVFGGYMGIHRLTAHADQYVTDGVVNDLSQLNISPQASPGTVENPFLILEIVPSYEEAEFGFMIDGCEPFEMKDNKSIMFNNGVSTGAKVEKVFTDEYDRDKNNTYKDGNVIFDNTWSKEEGTLTSPGYYEKVGDGKGNFVYTGSCEQGSDNKYHPVFRKVTDGTGDFLWTSIGDEDDMKQLGTIENKVATGVDGAVSEKTLSDGTVKKTYISYAVGDREYTTRTESGYYATSLGNNEGHDKYVHYNAFMRTALRLKSQAEVEKLGHIVVKTIEPSELNADTEQKWLEYADLIYMHKGGNSSGITKSCFNKNLTRRVTKTSTHKMDDSFSSGDDFNWSTAQDLFLKINGLGKYEDNFAPMMFDASVMNDRSSQFSATDKKLVQYPLDYQTMDPVKTTDYRGYTDNLGTNKDANSSNINKFLIMNFLMKQKNFYKYFFKNKRASNGETVIKTDNEIGICTTQDAGEPQTYWSVEEFLPVPDTNSLEYSDALLKKYGINRQGGAYLNYTGNVALAGGSFMYNADNMFSQFFDTAGIKEGDNTKDAFDWYKEQYGVDYGTISPVQMIHYLLNYKKRNGGDDYPGDTKGDKFRILEVEPCEDYTLSETLLNNYLPPADYTIDYQIDYMTTAEFNGSHADVCGTYDMVYIGANTGKMNYDNTTAKTKYNDTKLDSKIYTHVGDKATTDGKDIRYSGNDITSLRRKELISFAKSGCPIVLSAELMKTGNTLKKMVDHTSQIYDLLSKLKATSEDSTDPVYSNVITMSGLETIINSAIFNGSPVVIKNAPKKYDNTSTSSTALEGSSLQFSFQIGKSNLSSETTYGIRLFIDLNGDGIISDDTASKEMVYDSADNSTTYTYDVERDEEGNPVLDADGNPTVKSYSYSFDIQNYYNKKNMTPRRNGALVWKFVVYNVDHPTYYISNTGTSWYQANTDGNKTEINLLQIIDDADVTDNTNLQSAVSDAGTLFGTYANGLNDYDIKVTTMTLSAYLQVFKDEAGDLDVIDQQFEGYNVFMISCSEELEKADNSFGAVSYIINSAKAGVSVFYTTNAARESSGVDQDILQDVKSILNQDRFSASSNADVATYPESNSKANTYSADDYRSLEYSYARGNAVGKTGNTYTVFDSNTWRDVKRENAMKYGITEKATKATQINEGSISNYPYKIVLDDIEGTCEGNPWDRGLLQGLDIYKTAAQQYQLNMENPSLNTWYCLGGGDFTTYGISPNDATNNYYLYTAENMTYCGIDLANTTSATEMQLFINAIIGNYEAGYKYPQVNVTKVNGIGASNQDGVVAYDINGSSDAVRQYSAEMPSVSKKYLEYIGNNATPVPSSAPVATVTPEPVATAVASAVPTSEPETTASAAPSSGPIVVYENPAPATNTLQNNGIIKYDVTAILADLPNTAFMRITYHTDIDYNQYYMPPCFAIVKSASPWVHLEEFACLVGSSKDPREDQVVDVTVSDLKSYYGVGSADLQEMCLYAVCDKAFIDKVVIYHSQQEMEDENSGSGGGIVDEDLTSDLASKTDVTSNLETPPTASHRVYFSPFDNNVTGKRIKSLTIALTDSTGGIYSYVDELYRIDGTGASKKIYKYTAGADHAFSVMNDNYLMDSKEFFIFYNGAMVTTNYNYIKFDINNKKKTGTTYLNMKRTSVSDDVYMFPLD